MWADYTVINYVFGGNDIAGTIGSDLNAKKLPEELKQVIPEPTEAQLAESGKTRDEWRAAQKKANSKLNDVDKSFDAYVRVSTPTTKRTTAKRVVDPETGEETNEYYKVSDVVQTREKTKEIYIGQLFAGGNGNYDKFLENGIYNIYNKGDKTSPIASSATDFVSPSLNKTYLEVMGGSIVYAYGGGNNATVNQKTVIYYDNPSEVVNHIDYQKDNGEWANKLTDERFLQMGIDLGFSYPSSGAFQVGRLFGGNNKREMAIRPTWNLQSGLIRNLYSGGNRGAMTSPEGLLLEIDPAPKNETDEHDLAKNDNDLTIDYVFGGCRMADVHPKDEHGNTTTVSNLEGYFFPPGLSARVLVRGGDINNVYGGNDITGKVYGGNAVGVYTSIRGDIYGGGNGFYPYTDNWDLKDDPIFGDLYYGARTGDNNGFDDQVASVEALNAYRPNAEQVSIRIAGKASNYTRIGGSIYCGGNCATLINTTKTNPLIELKIGSYAIADKVFMGNNGEKMVSDDILMHYNYNVDVDASGAVVETGGKDFSSLELTNKNIFSKYMDGVVMTLQPSVVFDNKNSGDPDNYVDYTSYVGSFFLGGNVGSMAIPGKNVYSISRGLNIFDKFVGGSNNANVPIKYHGETELNAYYEGGILGHRDTDPTKDETDFTDASGNIKDRLQIDLENLTITPMRWNSDKTGLVWNTNKWGYIYTTLEAGEKLKEGDVYYTSIPYTEHTVTGSAYTVKKNDKYFKKLEDNVYTRIATDTELPVDSKYYTKTGTGKTTVTDAGYTATGGEIFEERDFIEVERDPSDNGIRLLGGNVYGGCYNSGHVNGNVIININDDVLKREDVFGSGTGASGVELLDQRDDLQAIALAVFGAGYGEETEIWGSSTVNLNKGYAFQIFGGGEMGVVGKKDKVLVTDDEDNPVYEYVYNFDPRYSSTVNLNGKPAAYATSSESVVEDLAEAEYIYGGGNEGDVSGNTYVNLGNGRIYDAFGGASDPRCTSADSPTAAVVIRAASPGYEISSMAVTTSEALSRANTERVMTSPLALRTTTKRRP